MHDSTIRAFLARHNLPDGDSRESWSRLRFDDGADFRIEIPTINSLKALEALLHEAENQGVTINRVTETLGMFRHTSQEISDYVAITSEHGIELMMSVGPRASYDISASVNTSQGRMVGYRLRGQEQIVRAIKDVARGIELGIRGFVVYDEGLLFLLSEMRRELLIPSEVHLKASAHMGYANPTSISILQRLGADSINPIRDLDLSVLGAIRQAVSVPLDIHTDNPAESGGFIRFYEVPQFVSRTSPVYLKTGNSVLQRHGQITGPNEARDMARQAAIVLEFITREAPGVVQSKNSKARRDDVSHLRIAG